MLENSKECRSSVSGRRSLGDPSFRVQSSMLRVYRIICKDLFYLLSWIEFASIQKDANSNCNCKFVESLKVGLAEKLALVEYGAVLKFDPDGIFGAYHLKKSHTAVFLAGFQF